MSNAISNPIPISHSLLIQFSALGFHKKICLEDSLYVLNDWIGSTEYVYNSTEANTVNPILLLIKQIQSAAVTIFWHITIW